MALSGLTAFAVLMALLLVTSFAFGGFDASDVFQRLHDFASNFGENADWFIIFAVVILIVFLSNQNS